MEKTIHYLNTNNVGTSFITTYTDKNYFLNTEVESFCRFLLKQVHLNVANITLQVVMFLFHLEPNKYLLIIHSKTFNIRLFSVITEFKHRFQIR